MGAHELIEPRSAVSRVEGVLAWLGGGHWRELGERHERSTHAVAGAVVLLGAVLAWLVAALAVDASARWPLIAVVALTLIFGLLVGAVTRGIASGPHRGRPGIAGRIVVAVAVGVVVGELAALVVFSRSIDHRLEDRALSTADSAPAVAQASAALQQTRSARSALDAAVTQARNGQDDALVVARCEYHPSPACPQTRITGDPGAGPETRTANELLADAQRELDTALAARDRQAPELDATISREQRAVDDARQRVLAEAGPGGVGARWIAMNDLTFAGVGALMLRLLTIAFFVLVYLLPLILRTWRGETTQDRHATARAERERAELDADTAIAIKRAEVRREAEILWAEHQLTQARLAIEAQTEIDREQQRRRVTEAIEGPQPAASVRTFEPVQEDIYLPIAAEAEAASRAVPELPAAAAVSREETAPEVDNLPAQIEPADERAMPSIPSIPDATRAAARWIRPLVPPFVARAIDNTTAPLRTARQVFEEVEEITFALRRTRKVTFDSESSEPSEHRSSTTDAAPTGRVASSRTHHETHDHPQVGRHSSVRLCVKDADGLPLGPADSEHPRELTERDGPRELRPPQGPRQLPPGK
ncbi:hypothetical protein AWC29_10270 [Mycobacterium triplex]|uniref:DUF4407 domain-containing protein n=2 Tax=Mycobacterium simiae complex TaxID=2249310 RepID=A0A1X1TX79_MYCFL|nr:MULTISPECIES: DUF4407 domain-containing protein [Mycobacterium simiae complex]MCV7413371.1 DUF4407 domain-containing protein [Mycobacterium florentinum]ORV49201.1 hypothetical protein AWC05_03330 [Mycobacterium florentinum]ORX05641.1 hypothetical protein AWC29_10270 [Mycobacterium triplex]CDO88730.1 putative integral membrane protein [Mycobacterium triplex]BBX76904.1 membrane protein [Mycobacterium florentinum]